MRGRWAAIIFSLICSGVSCSTSPLRLIWMSPAFTVAIAPAPVLPLKLAA